MLQYINISYKYHIIFAVIIRFILIAYSEFHDKYSEIPYTDVDYKVFTDASRHILNSNSPYDRHTYRYTPLLAIILIPNVVLHGCFGKILFSFVDIIVGLLIRTLVKYNRKTYVLCKKTVEKGNYLQLEEKYESVNDNEQNNVDSIRKRKTTKINKSNKDSKNNYKKEIYDYIPDYCMLFWIYNPMSIIITTRGNCDSIAVFLVLLTLYLLQYKKNYFVSGLIHGLAVHFRLYPLMYSLSYFMYLSKFSKFDVDGQQNEIFFNENTDMRISERNKEQSMIKSNNVNIEKRTIFKMKYVHYLTPNFDQIKLISGTLLSITLLTALFYYLYGYKFLYETYIYHLVRKDTRHNFSLFFYLQYLTSGVKNIGIWQKVLCILPQIVLLIVLSVRYGLNRFTLNFSILTQTIVMVTYNSVLTSQYFIWILGIMPLILWQLEMTIFRAIFWAILWFIAQLAWLLPAYLLEFHGQNTFLFIWLQGVSFFCANMAVLGRLIKCFMYRVE